MRRNRGRGVTSRARDGVHWDVVRPHALQRGLSAHGRTQCNPLPYFHPVDSDYKVEGVVYVDY
jgi:hypothetical protein